MRRIGVLLLTGLISSVVGSGCRREMTVQASAESAADAKTTQHYWDIGGQLSKVNPQSNTIVIRVDNGMEQTIMFDHHTTVVGGAETAGPPEITGKQRGLKARIYKLTDLEGSELQIDCSDENGTKVANTVVITDRVQQLSRSRKRRS